MNFIPLKSRRFFLVSQEKLIINSFEPSASLLRVIFFSLDTPSRHLELRKCQFLHEGF